tara:strand:+ start:241 stop:735 length:495 start_codon:yes stop_codon:yes gene_type:complete
MNSHIKNIYKKIVEQSKKKFFFDVFFVPKKLEAKIEIFQLNLIIILWYMKKKEFEQSEITLLINIFLKDLELLFFESGEGESRIPKKMRKMTENFYGRLISYSKQFDMIFNKNKSEVIDKLKINFNEEKIKYDKISKYLEFNLKHLSKIEKKDFEKLTFYEVSK